MYVTKQLLLTIDFHYMGKNGASNQTFFKISSLVFSRRKKFIHV